MYLVHLANNISHDGRLTDYIICNVFGSSLAIISDDDSPRRVLAIMAAKPNSSVTNMMMPDAVTIRFFFFFNAVFPLIKFIKVVKRGCADCTKVEKCGC